MAEVTIENYEVRVVEKLTWNNEVKREGQVVIRTP
jgi:hypothetical protein